MSREDFEALVADAIDEIPDEFFDRLENVAFFVEDEPPEGVEPDTLGFYDGVALTERNEYAGALPDRILVFRNPTLAICDTVEDVAEEVRITVFHEVGHYFGIDEDGLHDLGWA